MVLLNPCMESEADLSLGEPVTKDLDFSSRCVQSFGKSILMRSFMSENLSGGGTLARKFSPQTNPSVILLYLSAPSSLVSLDFN